MRRKNTIELIHDRIALLLLLPGIAVMAHCFFITIVAALGSSFRELVFLNSGTCARFRCETSGIWRFR